MFELFRCCLFALLCFECVACVMYMSVVFRSRCTKKSICLPLPTTPKKKKTEKKDCVRIESLSLIVFCIERFPSSPHFDFIPGERCCNYEFLIEV
jgi:hypothetical protein